MISDRLQQALNDQIKVEMWSANLYLSMSFYLQKEGYEGFASWMLKQAQEEMRHACGIADYMIKRGGIAKVDKQDVVPQSWNGVTELFEQAYEHECRVSRLIDNIVDIASADNDKASQDFLWTYVREQVEEESTALNIAEKLKKAGEAGILYMNDKLGQRA